MSINIGFWQKSFKLGFADIAATVKSWHVVRTLAWQDIAGRYNRSRIGAFWITIGMATTIACVGLIFGQLFNLPIKQFLPYFTVGTLLWGLFSSCLQEGCQSFINSSGIILQVPLPLFTHVLRGLCKELLVFAHNVVVFPLALLAVQQELSWQMLLAVPALMLVLVNLGWMMLVLAVICTRYRDVAQIVNNALQVLFFVTPVMWRASQLPERTAFKITEFNPLYHLINIVRAPLLGEFASERNWVVALVFALSGWLFVVLIFGRYRNRIAYWL
jgi:ABC-type polysaccharide/polyol phosphate export permease